MTRLEDCRTIQLPKILDVRGNLTFIEPQHIHFNIRRVYWIYDVPGGEYRGGHAYRELQEFIVAVSGSFDVELDDGFEKRIVPLNRSYYGLYIAPKIWRQLRNFSTNAVCVILASAPYDESDYLRDYDEFQRLRTPSGND
ncbi:MAG TPA: FdtA/QdtA family cupin domain-containing protein [Thermoanaerobaculia bacterium]|nr:FdtA/QdtA family cupin domain-containing protein [Thermoanaerobaculia bacterium]